MLPGIARRGQIRRNARLVVQIDQGRPGYSYQLRKTTESTVNAHVCAGVNCLPEIVQIDDLTAIFSD
jgi:hypothetical protein